MYGLDPDAPIPENDIDTTIVTVPDTNIPLSQVSSHANAGISCEFVTDLQ